MDAKGGASSSHLLLQENNGEIVGISTTGGSIWAGQFEAGVLTAEYRYNGRVSGTIRLELSEDGKALEGTWVSVDDYTGTYTAYRLTRIPNSLSENIQSTFGDRVQILE